LRAYAQKACAAACRLRRGTTRQGDFSSAFFKVINVNALRKFARGAVE